MLLLHAVHELKLMVDDQLLELLIIHRSIWDWSFRQSISQNKLLLPVKLNHIEWIQKCWRQVCGLVWCEGVGPQEMFTTPVECKDFRTQVSTLTQVLQAASYKAKEGLASTFHVGFCCLLLVLLSVVPGGENCMTEEDSGTWLINHFSFTSLSRYFRSLGNFWNWCPRVRASVMAGWLLGINKGFHMAVAIVYILELKFLSRSNRVIPCSSGSSSSNIEISME